MRSANAIAQVHDALGGVHLLARGQAPDQLEVDTGEVVEQPPPPPEQHRHHGELQRVEQARPQALLGGRGPVQQDVAVARGGLGLGDAGRDVGDVARRPRWRRRVR